MAGAASTSSGDRQALKGSNLTTGDDSGALSSPLRDPQARLEPSKQDGDADADDGEDVVYVHWSWPEAKDPNVEPGATRDGGGGGVQAHPHPHNGTVPGGGAVNNSSVVWDLDSANREMAEHLLWLLTVLAVLLLLTVLGSVLVCIVYRTRFRRNTASCFVVFLAILELAFMFLGVPMEMTTLALPLMYRSAAACKVVRYVETAGVHSLLLTLTAVALDRFCKLSRPASCLTMAWAKRLCGGAVLLGMVLASLAPVVFDASSGTVSSGSNVTTVTCGVSRDSTTGIQTVGIVYVSLLVFTYLFSVVTMAILYILMYIRICKRRAASRGERVSPARPYRHRFVAEDSTSSCGGGEDSRRLPTSTSITSTSTSMLAISTPRSGRTSPGIDPARVPLKSGVKESARIGQGSSTVVDVQSTQMMWIFFLVSLFAVLFLAPFVVLRSLQVLTDFLDMAPMDSLGKVVIYEAAVRLYFLHPPLVPLLYLLCNHNFLREAKLFLLKVGRSCKRQPSSSKRSNNSAG